LMLMFSFFHVHFEVHKMAVTSSLPKSFSVSGF
jgi:hypothetical protein